MIKVSIVIPVYKPRKEYLFDLFKSIKEQEFQDFEIIITDDGKDKEQIYETIPDELFEKIRYFENHGPHGIFGNLNNGLRNANGLYIQLFCQDDVMLPSLLHNNYLCFVKNPDADLVFSAANFITQRGEIIYFDYSYMQYVPTILLPKESNNYLLYFGCLPCNLSSVMIKNELFEKTGYFDKSYEFAGDFEFWIRVAQVSKIVFSKERNLKIRNHSLSASMNLGSFKRYNEIKRIYKFLMDHNSIPFSSNTLRRFLHINMFRSTISYLVRKGSSAGRLELNEFKELYDGRPYSLWIAFLAFIYPLPTEVKKLKHYMEVKRE